MRSLSKQRIITEQVLQARSYHERLMTDSLRHDSFGPREMGITKS
jgi:hypothetical protein